MSAWTRRYCCSPRWRPSRPEFCSGLRAWQISRLDRYDALKEGGRAGTAGLGRQHLRATLVVSEVALAFLLLVGAGLFLRSLASLQEVSPGFQAERVITANVALPPTRYADAAKEIAFYRAVIDRLTSLPGVTNVGAGVSVPFSGNPGSASFSIEGRPSPPGDQARTGISISLRPITSHPLRFRCAAAGYSPTRTSRALNP